jgi:hypothetical protein
MERNTAQRMFDDVMYSQWMGDWAGPNGTWWINFVIMMAVVARGMAWVKKVSEAADKINTRR